MAFLKRKASGEKALEAELIDLINRRELLQQKLATARTALAAASNERRMSLLDASLDDETAANRRDTAVRDAKDAIESLSDALAALGEKISDREVKLADLRDRAEREAVARQATAEVEALVSVVEKFREVSTRLTAAIEPLATRISSAADFLPRTQLLLSDIATVSAQLADEGRSYAAQVESGHKPLHHAPIMHAPEPAAPVERLQVYVRTPIKWREGAQTMMAARYTFADPPKSVAELALARGLASLPDAEITRLTIDGFGVRHEVTSPEMCLDLDALLAPPATELPAEGQPHMLPPGFVETVGQPRTITIDANRVG
jgi:hypothetical protein